MAKAEKEYDLHEVLALACVAQRINNEYVKDTAAVVASDNKIVAWKHSNRQLMLYAVKANLWQSQIPLPDMQITEEDLALVTDIKSFYKRLAFSVMADPSNSFIQSLIVLLNSQTIPAKSFGFIACLPSTYLREKKQLVTKKTIKTCNDTILAEIGTQLLDKDCEILEQKYSDTYSCWNILALVDDCIVSWMSKYQLQIGPCVLIKAKVKAHSVHWLYKKAETRLNYVKAFQ